MDLTKLEQALDLLKEFKDKLITMNTKDKIIEVLDPPIHKLKLKFYAMSSKAKFPKKAHESDAGMDIFLESIKRVRVAHGNIAHVDKGIIIPYGTIVLLPTGLKSSVPLGYELQVRPKSGLALKGLSVVNSPGTIDANYRGEIGVIAQCVTPGGYIELAEGDKIAQLVLSNVPYSEIIEIHEEQDLGKTDRGEGGFGSTGR